MLYVDKKVLDVDTFLHSGSCGQQKMLSMHYDAWSARLGSTPAPAALLCSVCLYRQAWMHTFKSIHNHNQ